MSKFLKFFANLWASLKSIFEGLLPELKEAIAFGVDAVEAFKKFVDSPTADAITAFIPGTWDDEAKEWLRSVLPTILTKLKMIPAELDNVDQAIAAAGEAFKNEKDEDIKKLLLHNMSVLIAKKKSEDKLTIGQGVAMQEFYYRNEVKKQPDFNQ